MPLQTKLDAFKANFEAAKPPYNMTRAMIETMHRATAELIASGANQRAIKAGDKMPVFTLSNAESYKVSSAEQPPREFHDWRAVHSHADACDTSCLDCLHSYSNLAYHNPLNSWLAIDMAQLPL